MSSDARRKDVERERETRGKAKNTAKESTGGNEAVQAIVAQRLRAAREMAGLSQGQVAKILDLHRPAITEIEAGRRRVATDELIAFARTYGTSVGWLCGEVPEVDLADDRMELAARELSKLSKADMERVIRVLSAIRNRSR